MSRNLVRILGLTLVAAISQSFVSPAPLHGTEKTEREARGAILDAIIIPISPENEGEERIQPGRDVKLSAQIRNGGDVPSAPGTFFIRFAYPKPLDKDPGSVAFQTEEHSLPSLIPGETLTIRFDKPHTWPSLFDYIRKDWAMRQYEAIASIKGKEYLTGSRPVSFSAYYYAGQPEKKRARVLSLDPLSEKTWGSH